MSGQKEHRESRACEQPVPKMGFFNGGGGLFRDGGDHEQTFLLSPRAREGRPCPDSHLPFIFIAGDIVCKVKKAVDFGCLDFTSLDKKQHSCREDTLKHIL